LFIHKTGICKEFYGDTLLRNPFKSRLTTVTYGTTSAPFLATRCLKKLADNEHYPRAVQVLSNHFYVDLLSGTSKIEDALNV
jgi:hypothetical protein